MKLTLVKKTDEAQDTRSFYFKSETPLTWLPGQYIYITLPKLNYEDQRGDIRHFTISASPTEGDFVRITIRVRQESGYKKTLDELPLGSVVEGKGPQGTFLFDKKGNGSNIFLAGGIGITPFRSMTKWIIDNNLGVPIHLIHSNSDSEFVFKSDFEKWADENKNIKLSYFDSSVLGHLDSKKLLNLLSNTDIKTSTFWVVGPNVFVDAMEDILEELKVPEDNIKTEKFTGY